MHILHSYLLSPGAGIPRPDHTRAKVLLFCTLLQAASHVFISLLFLSNGATDRSLQNIMYAAAMIPLHFVARTRYFILVAYWFLCFNLVVVYSAGMNSSASAPYILPVALPVAFSSSSTFAFTLMHVVSPYTIMIHTAAKFALLLLFHFQFLASPAINGELLVALIAVDIWKCGFIFTRLYGDRLNRDVFTAQQLRIQEMTSMTDTRSRFLSCMSHEFRTPLNGILGTVDLLLHDEIDAQLREELSLIETCGNQLLTMVNDMLDFSDMSQVGVAELLEPFNIHSLVEQVVQRFTPKLHPGVKLIIAQSQVQPQWLGQKRLLRQILVRLLQNAATFTEHGQVLISVTSATSKRNAARIEVSDTGIGISEEQRQKLFQPLSQLDYATTRPHGGLGMGLAICHQLVQRLGGEAMECESTLGVGSTFWFEVPLQAGGKA
eukprot:TRINITY_DN9508_c0_g1_i1.p1 TRINITY_DN9508_c0_g1~~TRINITY_DN9508_c0_g1_i1.p1  ORF type:complete len:435 (-),score=74.08 TRINITY_DN9508_c0_g1_i1:78-1382(-)